VQLVERIRALPRPEGKLAGYQLEQCIGQGGMAEVFRASRRATNGIDGLVQRVALKRLRTDHAGDPHFVRMFLDEARILARLSHPNIVQLLDAGNDSGTLYLAMELVEGATLQQIFRAANAREQRLSPGVVVEVGMQLCAALEAAHGLTGEDGRPLELVHRDISPQNVLVDRYGTVKLSDFGIARSADRLTETATGLIKGKMSYMAPEQIKGGIYDRRVDLYAVGVILFELLTGERLYRPTSDAELMYQILEGRNERIMLLAERAPEIGKVVRLALASDPDQRPATATTLKSMLAPLRAGTSAAEELANWVKLAIAHQKDAVARNQMETITSPGPTMPLRRA
jgi:serine/threonine protein kinase